MRQGIQRIVRQHLPDWPHYIIKDWLAGSLSINKIGSEEQLRKLKTNLERLNLSVGNWQFYSKMPLSVDKFNPYTRYRIKVIRDYGNRIQEKVPADKERVQIARSRVINAGIENCPPIILIKMPNGYELIEGWHRTMAAFELAHQNDSHTIKVNTWIGEPSALLTEATTELDESFGFYADIQTSNKAQEHLTKMYDARRARLMSETVKEKAEWIKTKRFGNK